MWAGLARDVRARIGCAYARVRSLWRPLVRVIAVDNRPEGLRANRLYVTLAAGNPAFGYMICPCGCRETLHLRFFGDRHPRWTLINLRDLATVEPSVWRTTGCRSHFVLTAGRIRWCR